MSRYLALMVCGIFAVGPVTSVQAHDGSSNSAWGGIDVPDCVGARCCDDYRRKCSPDARPVKCFTCDDYCHKCGPGVTPVKRFACDDFCRKSFILLCPCLRYPKCCFTHDTVESR